MTTYKVSRSIGVEDRGGHNHITFLRRCDDARGNQRCRVRITGGGIAHCRRIEGGNELAPIQSTRSVQYKRPSSDTTMEPLPMRTLQKDSLPVCD